MKKLLVLILLVIFTVAAYSQDLRLRSYSSTYSYADSAGKFNDLIVNEIKSNILIVIGDSTITAYAKKETIYSIVARDEIKYDNTGAYATISLLDDEKITCIAKVYVMEYTDTYHVIIEYKNVMFIYNCREE